MLPLPSVFIAIILWFFASPLSALTIVCLGDSLTAGRGLDENEAFPAQMQVLAHNNGHADWTVINAGISGDTTAAGLRRVQWALRAKPDIVLIELGANDGLRGVATRQTIVNLEAIIDQVVASGARAFLAGMQLPPNYGEDFRQSFAAIFPTVAKERHVPLMPFLLAGVAGEPALVQGDGLHPNADGQRVIAAHVYGFLEPLLVAPEQAAP